MNRML